MKFDNSPIKLPGVLCTFINRYENLIDAGNFYLLYRYAERDALNIQLLTRALYDAGLDPLDGSKQVFAEFLSGSPSATEIIIPEGITKIEDSAFYNCNKVTEITLPQSVEIIDAWAIAGMDNLEEITIKGKLKVLNPLGIHDLPLLERIFTVPENKELLLSNVSALKSLNNSLPQARIFEI